MRTVIGDFVMRHLKKWIATSFVFVFVFIQAKEVSPEWKHSLNSMSTKERQILHTFFKTMILNSQGGYVLFGSKPSCMEGIIVPEACKTRWIGKGNHRRSVDLWEGYQVWEKYFEQIGSQKLIITCKSQPNNLYSDWIHLNWINPRKLLEVVDENIVLFQYVLGPELTAKRLLDYLTDPLKNSLEDYSLVGVILGFGVRNTLYYRRLELIVESLHSREQAPFKDKYERLKIAEPFGGSYTGFDLHPALETTPSFNNNSLSDEYQLLDKLGSGSKENPHQQLNPTPTFAIYNDDKYTRKILSDYARDQLKIRELLSQDNFLEQTLKIIFE